MLCATISGARPVAAARRRTLASRSGTIASSDAPSGGVSVTATQGRPWRRQRASHGFQTPRLQPKPCTSTMPTCPRAPSVPKASGSACSRKATSQLKLSAFQRHAATQARNKVATPGARWPARRQWARMKANCAASSSKGQSATPAAPASASRGCRGHHQAHQANIAASAISMENRSSQAIVSPFCHKQQEYGPGRAFASMETSAGAFLSA